MKSIGSPAERIIFISYSFSGESQVYKGRDKDISLLIRALLNHHCRLHTALYPYRGLYYIMMALVPARSTCSDFGSASCCL
jgi:hypothetical protein